MSVPRYPEALVFGLLCLYKKNQHPPNCVPVNQCFVVCFKSRVFLFLDGFLYFLPQKPPKNNILGLDLPSITPITLLQLENQEAVSPH